MKTYRAKIRMVGGYISNLQSDTLFGGMCWAYKSLYGEDALTDMLENCKRGQPPFVLSDMFPGDYLPRPFLPPVKKLPAEASKTELLAFASEAKTIKERSWLSLAEFQAVLAGEYLLPEKKEDVAHTRLTLHNTINRLTGTTLEEGGGLYELPETVSTQPYMSLYLKIQAGLEERTWRSLERLGQFGIGKRRSIGKGGFSVAEYDPFDGFHREDANAFVSLSHFIPNAGDPVSGRYKTMVKFAKLDRDYALKERPFKYPLIMMIPGSVFYTGTYPRDFYGMAVEQIAPGFKQAVQGCFAFAVPARVTDL